MKRIIFTIIHAIIILLSLLAVAGGMLFILAGAIWMIVHSAVTFIILSVILVIVGFAISIYDDVNDNGDWNP